MGYYAYCVVPAGHAPPPSLHGIHDAAVVERPIGALAMWLSEIDRPATDLEQVRAHNRIVEAAVTEEVTPVPLRFGQWAGGVQDLEDAIAVKTAWYQERLRTFAGALEFGLRIIKPGKPRPAQVVQTVPAVTGLEFMQTLLDRAAVGRADRDDSERARAVVTETLGGLVRAETVEMGRTAHAIANIAHLVARSHFDEYRAAALGLRTRLPGLRFLLSGPWAPYSFAG